MKEKLIKRLCQIFVVTVLIFTMTLTLYAHSGGTDSRGGHHNRKSGGYHYHHGMGPHQHTNGSCPYDADDEADDDTDGKLTFILVFWSVLIGAMIYKKFKK